MRILVVDPFYDNEDEGPENEGSEKFYRDIRREFIQELDSEVNVAEADAGPGASVPALWVEIFIATVAILGTPKVVVDNLPLWKDFFDRAVGILQKRSIDFSIDPNTAVELARFYTLNRVGGTHKRIEVANLARQYSNVVFGVEAISLQAIENKTDADDPRSQNIEAVKQLQCRYIVGVEVDGRRFTVVIERDGHCSYLRDL